MSRAVTCSAPSLVGPLPPVLWILHFKAQHTDANSPQHPPVLPDPRGPPWSLYYHQFLDARGFDLLQLHAKRLTETSACLEEWHQSPYGKPLRICDSVTLAKVREVWTSYATASSGQSKAEFERARQAKEARGGNASVITAARSAPPFTLDAVVAASALFQQYWDTGTTDASDAAPIANPMFSG